MHAKRYSYPEALSRLRAGSILLNQSHGTPNNGGSGYHETLTVFWVNVVTFFVSVRSQLSEVETVNAFLSSTLTGRGLPFLFYEREHVLSSHYRAQFFPPTISLLDAASLNRILSSETKI